MSTRRSHRHRTPTAKVIAARSEIKKHLRREKAAPAIDVRYSSPTIFPTISRATSQDSLEVNTTDIEYINDEDDSGVYEVERVVGHKKLYGQLEYEIKWVGYPGTTFEPAGNLHTAKEALDDYHQSIGGDPSRKKNTRPSEDWSTLSTTAAKGRQKRLKATVQNMFAKSEESEYPAVSRPSGSWDAHIQRIAIIRSDDETGDTRLMALVDFKDAKYDKCKVSTDTLRKKAPNTLFDFYEANLSFD